MSTPDHEAPPARLLVVIPTVAGRDEHLHRCLTAYDAERAHLIRRGANVTVDVRVYHDLPTCAHAWNLGAELARDDGYHLLHLTADDLAPRPGALDVGLWRIGFGEAPAALIWNGVTGAIESHGMAWGQAMPDGSPTTMVRIPTLRTEWWHPIPEIHYWSDNAVSSVLAARGVPMVCDADFVFDHFWAAEGRQVMAGPRAEHEQRQWMLFDQDVRGRANAGSLSPWVG